MNSLQKLPFTKTLAAAAIAAAGLSTSGVALSLTPVNGSPDDGVFCRNSPSVYTGSQVVNSFFCKRTKTVNTVLQCLEPGFPTKVIREGPNGGGKDLCAAPNRNYTSNSALTGTEGTDYKFFAVDTAKVATVVANQRRDEALALGVPESEVDAKSLTSLISINQLGSEDKLQVTVEFATFAIPTRGIVIGNPGPVGLPATSTSTVPFVPKALPR